MQAHAPARQLRLARMPTMQRLMNIEVPGGPCYVAVEFEESP